MGAVFKREFKAYCTSPLGIIYITLMLAVSGFLFGSVNLAMANGDINNFYWFLSYALVPFVPFLTMRLFANDKIGQEGAVLLAAPLKPGEIVTGKFLAVFAFWAVPVVPVLLYQGILAMYGAQTSYVFIVSFLSMIIFSGAVISIGALISVLVRNQPGAAIATFVVLLAIFFFDLFYSFIDAPWFVNVTGWISVYRRYQTAALGVLEFSSVFYLISFTVLMLIISARLYGMQYKKAGRRDTAYILAVIAVFIAVNIGAGAIDLRADITYGKWYAISDESKQVLDGLEQEVTATVFFSPTGEVKEVKEVLDGYGRYCDKVTVRQELLGSDESVRLLGNAGENGTVVFSCGEKIKTVPLTEILGFNMQTSAFDILLADRRYCNAVKEVAGDAEQIYIALISGHGEIMPEGAKLLLEKENCVLETVNIEHGQIDSKYDAAIISSPSKDFSEIEIERLEAFMDLGKGVQLYTDIGLPELPRLTAFAAQWGVGIEESSVIETDASKMLGGSQQMLTGTLSPHAVNETMLEDGRPVVFYASRRVNILWDEQNDIVVSPLVVSSGTSYAGTLDESGMLGLDSEQGASVLASVSEKEMPDGTRASLIVTGTSAFLDDMMELLTLNRDFVLESVRYQAGKGFETYVPARQMNTDILNNTAADLQGWTVALGIALPLLFLAVALVLYVRRRRR